MDLAPPREGASLTCLADLAAAAQELSTQARQLAQWQSLVGEPPGPGLSLERRLVLVEQLVASLRSLARDGNRFRRMEARALYAEGLTMAQLAAVFGVSRQRVSMLLHDGRAAAMDDEAEAAVPVLAEGPG